MRKPEVSIILPFYNDDKTLYNAIESIVCQSFKNWELLLVSNNGNDLSVEIALKWVEKDSRISLFHEPQQGVAYALNHGLTKAEASLIARMDADDISHATRLEKQVRYLHKYPKVDVVSCQTEFISSVEKNEGFSLFVQWQNSILSPENHFENRFVESPLAHPTVMFRKKLIEKYGFYSTDNVPEDYELWLRWMHQSVNFIKLPEKLYIWHDHSQRLSRQHSNYSKEAFQKVKCNYLAQWIQQNNIHKERRIIICGAGADSRRNAGCLSAHGIDIFAYTDVKKRQIKERFIPYEDLKYDRNAFFITFIAKRGIRTQISEFLNTLGYKLIKDYILAG
ncbi:MAG: glycosyltransferase [Bacteroidales bacterium]|nr:glycosyltransferase [Bacteroidales bacterium]